MRSIYLVVIGFFVGVGSAVLMAQRGDVPFPDAVTADPAHYSVSFENELVRILRVSYRAGDKSIMHRHPATYLRRFPDRPDLQLHSSGWDDRTRLRPGRRTWLRRR